MAPKNEKPEPEAVPESEAEPKGKGKGKLPPFVLYIAIAAIMAAAGYFAGTKMAGAPAKEPEKAAAETKKGKESKKAESKKKVEGPTVVVNMDDLIVNPSGTSGTRFLSVSLGFELGSQETAKMFEERQPLIRDALITILGSKTIEQLSDPKQKEITRYQIKKRVEQLLKVEDLAAVYFTDFIIQ